MRTTIPTQSDTLTITIDGVRIVGARKPKRDAYIRISATIVSGAFSSGHDAWSHAVDVCYGVYGAMPTEDNTIGQLSQVDGVDGSKKNLPTIGRVFSFGLNLYGRKCRDVWMGIERAIAKHSPNAV